ncbi:hypothetical protein [Micromonospora sp. WMMD1155]|nr:hypothetical protein [Micromonospora sp. WMMD1155]WFE53701.1 hypothetical protein O7617_26715 [Micromonospora sp. WMMD1155]
MDAYSGRLVRRGVIVLPASVDATRVTGVAVARGDGVPPAARVG